MTAYLMAIGWLAAACLVVLLVGWAVMEAQCWHNRRLVARLQSLRPGLIEVWREDGDDGRD